jgi:type IV secretion system protein VirB9
MRVLVPTALLLGSVSLGACSTTWKPPEVSYDDTPRKAVLSPDPPKPVRIVEIPKLLPLPGQLKPIPGREDRRGGGGRSPRSRRAGER